MSLVLYLDNGSQFLSFLSHAHRRQTSRCRHRLKQRKGEKGTVQMGKKGGRQMEGMVANVGFNCQSAPPSCCGENKTAGITLQLYSRPQKALTQMVGKRQRGLSVPQKVHDKKVEMEEFCSPSKKLPESWQIRFFAGSTLYFTVLFHPLASILQCL